MPFGGAGAQSPWLWKSLWRWPCAKGIFAAILSWGVSVSHHNHISLPWGCRKHMKKLGFTNQEKSMDVDMVGSNNHENIWKWTLNCLNTKLIIQGPLFHEPFPDFSSPSFCLPKEDLQPGWATGDESGDLLCPRLMGECWFVKVPLCSSLFCFSVYYKWGHLRDDIWEWAHNAVSGSATSVWPSV